MKILPLFLIALITLGFNTSCMAEPQEWVGKQLPEMKLELVSGKIETGKPMIVEFWATWCPPCRKSIPHLNEIYKKYKDKGLSIIGISDEDKAVIEKFTQTTPMDYTVAIDKDDAFSKPFGIKGIPHAFLVDKTGKITWAGHPMKLTDADIEKLIQ